MTAKSQKNPLPDALKPQLQAKSTARRKSTAAETGVAAAQSRRGRNDLQPAIENVRKPLNALRPSAARARETTKAQLERVIMSIKQFGLVMPVLIDKDDQIVSGHIVWEAARKLGFETIECRIVDHLEGIELRALSLALNRIAETGRWDIEILREQMIEIETGGIDLSTTGFTLSEIDQITLTTLPTEEEGEEGTEDDPESEPPVSIIGDLFQLGDHRLLCGDALDEASYKNILGDQLAQSVFSDSPYNCKIDKFVSGLGKHKHVDFEMACGELDDAQFTEFLKTYLTHCMAFTSKGAVIYACMDWRQIEKLLMAAGGIGLKRNNIVVWNKGSGGMGSLYRSAHEFIAVFCNGKVPATNNVELGRHGRDRTNVWSYPGANRRGSSSGKALADHPTPKPVELVEDALLDVTNRGEIVLDPFLGSGTTMIAAEQTGRICCGIELDTKYVDRAIRRWEEFTGKQAIHIASGLTLEELITARASTKEDNHD